ncbi:phage tail assembly chaperone G [Bacillus sp. z60-11]|uniref:phage tail assembly chaperone G n=1 Tax=Bacillus sp. z60-11 TaxID=3377704 RepID=UPI00396CEE05
MAQKQISVKLWFEKEEKYKTFIAPRTNTKTLYEALELDEAAIKTKNIKEVLKSLEDRMKFIVRVFRNQFTLEEFQEGLQSFEVSDEVRRIMGEIMGYEEVKEEEDFLPEAFQQKKE